MKVPELRRRILFTLAMIVVVRLGVQIPLPGIDVMELQKVIEASANASGPGAGLATVLTIFSGGGLQQCGIFALGIMPYISASIMTQLLSAVVPQWAKMVREEGGRQKMTKWTRAIAIVIALVQGWFLVGTLEHPERLQAVGLNIPADCQLVIDPGIQFALMTVLIMVAGTMFLMWIGDQITERGVGNGVSLIISVNIIHALPGAVTLAWKTLVYKDGTVVPMGAMLLVALIAFLIVVVALVVTVTQAQRRIPVQYAKRVMGNKMFNGATQYLPLKLNYSGVMPVIFATAILSLPQVLFSQIAHYNTTLQWIATKMNDWLNPASSGYYIISGLMIFFFSYFWVATMFQPSQIAEDLKRNGGYIPGIRPGPPTALFLDQTMQRLTFAGSAFLTLIYFLPSLLNIGGNIPYLVTQFFGGTSLLILVGVLLDMMRQVETTLLSRNYDGFLKKASLRANTGTSRVPAPLRAAAPLPSCGLLSPCLCWPEPSPTTPCSKPPLFTESKDMKELKHFILVGAPASGKGTQGRFLADTFGLHSLSTGSLLRREVESCTELGRKALSYMDRAMLVPDEIVNDMVRGWLSEMDHGAWLLDGYPRTVAQAETLDHFLNQRGTSVDVVVWMDVSRELIEQRIMRRRECSTCGYVVQTPEEKCSKCGGKMVSRKDDNMEAFARRWKDFEAMTLPVARYYEARGLVVKMTVSEEREPAEVSRDLARKLEEYRQ